jgi:hypothetical protein
VRADEMLTAFLELASAIRLRRLSVRELWPTAPHGQAMPYIKIRQHLA